MSLTIEFMLEKPLLRRDTLPTRILASCNLTEVFMRFTRILFVSLSVVLAVLFSPADHLNLYRAQTSQVAAQGAVAPDNPCYDAISVSPQPALIQNTPVLRSAQGQAASGDPPDTIDGAKHPELIPDDVAYRLIFLAVAEPEGAPADRIALARAKIAPARLSEDDAVAFLTLLTAFRKQFDALNAQETDLLQSNFAVHPLSTVAEQLRGIRAQRAKLFADTVAAMPARLSEGGVAKLGEHLQREKHAMKMFPSSYENGKPVY